MVPPQPFNILIGGNALNRKRKILAGALTAALLLTLSIPAFATSGDVAGAVEQTWTSAQGQIKTVVNARLRQLLTTWCSPF